MDGPEVEAREHVRQRKEAKARKKLSRLKEKQASGSNASANKAWKKPSSSKPVRDGPDGKSGKGTERSNVQPQASPDGALPASATTPGERARRKQEKLQRKQAKKAAEKEKRGAREAAPSVRQDTSTITSTSTKPIAPQQMLPPTPGLQKNLPPTPTPQRAQQQQPSNADQSSTESIAAREQRKAKKRAKKAAKKKRKQKEASAGKEQQQPVHLAQPLHDPKDIFTPAEERPRKKRKSSQPTQPLSDALTDPSTTNGAEGKRKEKTKKKKDKSKNADAEAPSAIDPIPTASVPSAPSSPAQATPNGDSAAYRRSLDPIVSGPQQPLQAVQASGEAEADTGLKRAPKKRKEPPAAEGPQATSVQRAAKAPRKRKETAAADVPQAASVLGATEPRTYDHGLPSQAEQPANANAAPESPTKRKSRMSDAIDEALMDDDEEGRARQRQKTRSADGNTVKDKDAFLRDIVGMTTREVMCDRYLTSTQAKWLSEDRGVKYKEGAFSEWEDDHLFAEMQNFKEDHGMTEKGFRNFVFQKNRDQHNAEQYLLLWKRLTGVLEGRLQRAVRLHVRRLLNEKGGQGAWSDHEKALLDQATQEFGDDRTAIANIDWTAIADRIPGRTAEDCRMRYRDFDVEGKKVGRWSPEDVSRLSDAVMWICAEQGVDPQSEDHKGAGKIPWKRIREEAKLGRSILSLRTQWEKYTRDLPRWDIIDDFALLDRVGQQTDALKKDDFLEVDMKSLVQGWQPWPPNFVMRGWKRLITKYGRPNEAFYGNLKDKLARVRPRLEAACKEEEAIEGAETLGRAVRRRKLSKAEDLIESEEEV